MSNINKEHIERVFGVSGALESSDIPYDGSESIKDKLDVLDVGVEALDVELIELSATDNLTKKVSQVIHTENGGASYDVILPSFPDVNDEIHFYHKSDGATNPIVVKGSIEGNVDGVSMDYENAYMKIKYNGATWKIIAHNA